MYQGSRSDLRDEWDDDEGVETQEELLVIIMTYCRNEPRGFTAKMLSEYTECSKEWCRQYLNRLVKKGILRVRKIGQLHLFYKNEESQ